MRSKRKLRTDMELKTSGGIFDLIDNIFKEIYFVNDKEFDYISEKATDEELDILTLEEPNFGEKRKCLLIVDKYLKEFNSKTF